MKIFVLCQEYSDVETLFLEVAKAEAVIRRPVSREHHVISDVSICRTCGGRTSNGQVFLLDIRFPLSAPFYKFSILIFHPLTLYNTSK